MLRYVHVNCTSVATLCHGVGPSQECARVQPGPAVLSPPGPVPTQWLETDGQGRRPRGARRPRSVGTLPLWWAAPCLQDSASCDRQPETPGSTGSPRRAHLGAATAAVGTAALPGRGPRGCERASGEPAAPHLGGSGPDPGRAPRPTAGSCSRI